jgi:osmotically-inducible protein OsmY
MLGRCEQARVVGWRSETAVRSLPAGQRGEGSGMDRDIRAAVYQELNADRLIDAADIQVEVIDGEVSLNGTVPSQDQHAEAAAAAGRIAGVTVVHNLLDVALPSGDDLENADLAQRVNGALAAKGVPDGVRVTAREGDIFLTGTVRDGAQRAAADEAAAGVGGVLRITNLIEVQDGA